MNNYMKDPKEFMEEQKRKNEEARNAALNNASLGPNNAVQGKSSSAVSVIITIFAVIFILMIAGMIFISFIMEKLDENIDEIGQTGREYISLEQAEDNALDSAQYLSEISGKKNATYMAVTVDTCQKVVDYYTRKTSKEDAKDLCKGDSIWVATEGIGTYVNVYLMDASHNVLLVTANFAFTDFNTMAYYESGSDNAVTISGLYAFKEAKF